MLKRILSILFLVVVCGILILVFKRKNLYSHKYKGTLIEQYGKGFNPERERRSLPIIEDSWVVRISDSSHTRWTHESRFNSRDVPQHIWKTLYFKDSILVSEEDAFNYDQGDTIGDRLIVVANFSKPDSIQFKFSRHYYKRYPPSESFYVEYDFADSVLNSWGFKNYYENLKKQPIKLQKN